MKNRNIFLAITVCICSFFCTNGLHAQKPRIAIVPLADSTLVCFEKKHLSNRVYPVDAKIPIVHYIVESITNRTRQHFEAELCLPPAELIYGRNESCRNTVGRDLLQWANQQKQYDYFIFLKNNPVYVQMDDCAKIFIPENSNGIVKELNQNRFSLFTTIGLQVYETSSSNFIPCFDYFDKYFYQLNKIKLPQDNYNFSPELTEKLKANFRAFMDQRVKHVLSETIYMQKEDLAGSDNRFVPIFAVK